MKQVGDYNKITTYLIPHIRKTYKHGSNIAKAIERSPTDNMIGDYMRKPLHGAKFDNFWQQIMHLPVTAQLMMAAVLH